MPAMLEFWKILRSLLRLARLSINDRLSQLDLSSAAGDIIFYLNAEESGLSQEALGERLSIGKAAISRTVDSLVRKGLVQRTQHPRDARANLVRLTTGGLAISAEVCRAYDDVFRIIRLDIPDEDFLDISALLHRILNNLSRERSLE